MACELRISSGLKHYVPKCLSFSHNFKQSNTIYSKSQLFFSTFLPSYNSKPFTLHALIQWRVTCPFFQGDFLDCLHSINPRPFDLNRLSLRISISHNKKSLAYFALQVKHLFALPTHEVFKVVPFGSFIVIDVVLLATSAAGAGNDFSVGLKNLFASNVYISHNWKQYSTTSENCKNFFHFFSLFFRAVSH